MLRMKSGMRDQDKSFFFLLFSYSYCCLKKKILTSWKYLAVFCCVVECVKALKSNNAKYLFGFMLKIFKK